MNDLYFEINPIVKRISGPPINLDTNWKNIAGIIFLSREELYDLSWAGHPNLGFVKICEENIDIIKPLGYDNNNLNRVKLQIINQVSKNRYEKETSPLEIDEKFSLQLTERCKLSLLMKYNECLLNKDLKFKWKTLNGFTELTSEEFLNLYNKIQNFIQNLFELEYEITQKIKRCQDLVSLLELDLNISCENKISL